MNENKCPYCGANIDIKEDGFSFCHHCGKKVFFQNGKTTTEKPKNKKIYVIALIVIALLAAVVFNNYNIKKESSALVEEEPLKKEEKTTNTVADLKNLKIGDVILFGNYEQDGDRSNDQENIEWIILKKQEDKCLLISKYVLDAIKYNDVFEFTSWHNSSIRRWLNEDFLQIAFSEEENSYLLKTINTTEYASNEESKDKVFLLSVTEANEIFKVDQDRAAIASEYAKAQGAYVHDGNACSYWLRSVCEDNEYAMNVRSAGEIRYSPEIRVDDATLGVRPTIWVSYEPLEEEIKIIENKNETKAKEKALYIIEILDDKMGVYSSYDDGEWLDSVYKGDTYNCYETKNIDGMNWYRIDDSKWIKDSNGTRVKTPESESNIIELPCYGYDHWGYYCYWYQIGSNDYIKLSKKQEVIDNKIKISKDDYIVYHKATEYVFYRVDGDAMTIIGDDNDFINSSHILTDGIDKLQSLVIATDIVGVNGFNNWNIKNLYLKAEAKNISDYSFSNCENLENIYILNAYQRIESNAFESCPIKNIYYCGSEEDFNNYLANVAAFNSDDINIHYNYEE